MSEFDTVLGSFGTVVDVFNILSSVATLVLGFMGFVVSKIMQGKNMREAMELEYARRRELVKEACAGVRMEFAIGLFQNQSYGHPERKKIVYGVAMAGKPPENKEVADAGELKPRDWRLIFGRAPPEEVWHAAARSDFLIFMETLRPCAHLIGDGNTRIAIGDGRFAEPTSTMGIENPKVDPICFRLRLTLSALAFWWSPTSSAAFELSKEDIEYRQERCSDEMKAWIKAAYCDGDEREWALFVSMCEVFVPGRIGVARSASKSRGVSSAGSGEWPPLDGDRVEANYKQGGNWYKGKVVTSYEANYRTLYDIAYDDGDAEQGVELSDLRQVGGGGESQSQKLLASQDV